MSRRRLVILGIDGGDFNVLRKLDMGFLRLLDARGRIGTLERDWREDRGWAMMLCGKDASFTGGYYWAQVTGTYLVRPTFRSDHYCMPPLWRRLDQERLKTAFLAVPTTFPPTRLEHGIFVAGGGGGQYPTLAECVVPESLLNTDSDLFDDLVLDVRNQVDSNLTPRSLVTGLIHETRTKARLLAEIHERHDRDLTMGVFVGPDRIQHLLWPHLTRAIEEGVDPHGVLDYYHVLDDVVTALIDGLAAGGSQVMVCSDHGFAGRTHDVALNQILVELGFQSPRIGSSPSLLTWAEVRLKDRVSERMRRFYRRVRPWKGFAPPGLDWRRTVAFANTAAGIWVNLEGRFPSGSVAAADRESVVDEIVPALKKVKDPLTGHALFRRVSRREEVYSGPEVERAPDVLVDLDESYEITNRLATPIVLPYQPAPLDSKVLPRSMSAIHSTGGVYGVLSPSVEPASTPLAGPYTEVHGAILGLLGLGVSSSLLPLR